ncbi:tRNA (adenosine(37)-N6)-threonylcarbamoyltransferase complex dimerization subunit type 1 TsaB [Siminovitchia acidinfaciens]|uniref:tRNA (Adenosine(37)-N6)-threonylcarbamoyltransferase complex dimerization subunit type 1 TsaB n=1 Tax=Siminovitchia acidinfaciens TaxID=2321395 RepID=A0A429XWQ1_9BACI|nr:tRNA (adenosine(37)-N6)-threonylcarbamoyltransferase complex dimerization subunit type 1 TsaB [Siminovitchia acidinfaciens]RST72817.1 tRNA (adenosine(37)-N6)-threonylcarbamoyltransferase complex dimerization subunit type 1 TsaB [Siminovitchia acidinfaciens]
MKILAIDTSNDVLGIALVDETKVIGEYITNLKKNHSVRVMPAIERLLVDCETKPTELDKIVVAGGPGSYTGVRIGVTIAKTMAWSLGIPLSSVSSLQVLAASGRYFPGLVSPLFDARRGLIYTGLYCFENQEAVMIKEDQNIPAAEWADMLKETGQPILFVGNDLAIHRETLSAALGDLAHFAAIGEYNPRPGELGLMGISRPEENVHTFTPNYIRLVEAEAKWLERQGKMTND